ncbi:MAG: RNA polymerase sigma factor [Bacteroidota bacterium]
MKNKLLDEDIDLVQRCLKGDTKAQFTLYHRYATAMLNVAYRILGQEEEAKDVLQLSFLKAFRSLDQLKNKRGFGGWLKKIVVNYSINQLKRRGWQWTELNEEIIESYQEKDREEQLQFHLQSIKRALLQLPTGYRTVLSLYLIEGYDHSEIAQILNVSTSTALSQYSRGKKKLRQIILDNRYQKKN